MKKKRMIASLIVMFMFTSSVLTSFAAKSDDVFEENYTESTCLNEVMDTGDKIELIGRDYENGDAELIQMINGEVVSKYYVDRSEKIINEVLYENGNVVNNNSTYKEAKSTTLLSPKNAPRAYTTAGTLYWNWTDGHDAGVCGARISINTEVNTKDEYNLNGKYQDLAALASFICGVLTVPISPATELAKNVLTYFGLQFSVKGFTISKYMVSAVSKKVTHKATDTANSSHSNSLAGTEYTVKQTGYSQKKYYSGHYYSETSYANRDKVYANVMYNLLFSYPSYSIKSW